jgi:hypothetical protein
MTFVQGGRSPATFQDLTLFRGKRLHIATTTCLDLSVYVNTLPNQYAKNVTDPDACEILVTNTHSEYGDTMNTIVWLPLTEHAEAASFPCN